MATLTGNAINTSYQGLVKFDDNGTVDPTTLKQLTDGTGGSLPIQVSQIQTKFQTFSRFYWCDCNRFTKCSWFSFRYWNRFTKICR